MSTPTVDEVFHKQNLALSPNVMVYLVLYKIVNPTIISNHHKWWLCNAFDDYASAEAFVNKYFNSTHEFRIKEFLCIDCFHRQNIMNNESRLFEQEYMDHFECYNIVDNQLESILNDLHIT